MTMEIKDNVCEQEITRTEQGSRKDGDRGSTVLGKFKDADALARAYESLQAEFTKRSQRLKELERAHKETDNTPQGMAESGSAKESAGVEKLRAAAKAKRAREKVFDEFVAELETAQADDQTEVGQPVSKLSEDGAAIEPKTDAETKQPLGGAEEERPTVQQKNDNGTETDGKEEESAYQKETEQSVYAATSGGVSSDALYEAVKKDEKARMRIVGDYLASIRRSDAPLMRGGFGVVTTPTLRAKNISEAGEMALQFFRRDHSNA